MCDTVVATGEVTRDGVTVFGKNSDREPNEAHLLLAVPAQDHPAGSRLRLTYIEIPQAAHTYAVLLAKPFWIWGAEMGANEHGVVIGNEAVFTKAPYNKEPGMIGMDLLRLGLERGATAHQALEVITGLLERWGQGGNCGFTHPFYYHNSFLIADPHAAWVLETAGPHWAARQVRGIYTISNGITLGNQWDLASPDLVKYAVERGWCKGRDDFDFGRVYSEPVYTYFGACRYRCSRTTQLLEEQRGRVTVHTVMQALRDHGDEPGRPYRPDRGLLQPTVCMHSGFGPVRGDQSIGSMVSQLAPDLPTHFFTATSAPCTGVFKPVWLDAGLPEHGPQPTGVDDGQSLFWRHERLHRATLADHPARLALYQAERDALEQHFAGQALALAAREPAGSSPAERRAYSERAFAEAEAAEADWLQRVERARPARPGWLYGRAWQAANRAAGFPSGAAGFSSGAAAAREPFPSGASAQAEEDA
ncbi:MAG: C69 family dipeptidase [Chloroflexota bacterium]